MATTSGTDMLMLQNDVIMIDAGKLDFRGATAGTFLNPELVGNSTWAGQEYPFRELVLSHKLGAPLSIQAGVRSN
jgi:hypothetical protein